VRHKLIFTMMLSLGLALASGLSSPAFADLAALCKQKKAKAAGSKAVDLFKAFGANSRKRNPARLAVDVSKAQSKFTSRVATAENKEGCLTTGDVTTIESKVDAFVADVVAKTSIRRGQEFQINSYTTDFQDSPAVAIDDDGNFVVVWTSDGAAFSYEIVGQRYDSGGTPLGSEFLIGTATNQGAAVAIAPDGRFMVVWRLLGTGEVIGQLYDSAGIPLGSQFQVNTYTTGLQQFPSISVDASGNFTIVWESRQVFPDVGQDGDDAGVYGQRYDSSGAPLGGEFQVNTYTTFSQRVPSVAASADGGFVVVWTSTGPLGGDPAEVFARRYDDAGSPLGSEFAVNTYTTTLSHQDLPRVAVAANGAFVVVWESRDGQDGDDGGVFGQRYDATGAPLGGEFQVNTYTRGRQSAPDVSMNAGGDFVVVWNGGQQFPTPSNQDGDRAGIFGQRYGTNGEPLGDEFQVNTYTTGSQVGPSAALSADGAAVVVWTDSGGQDGDGTGVFGQRYDLDP
jgi:hypothetical protein